MRKDFLGSLQYRRGWFMRSKTGTVSTFFCFLSGPWSFCKLDIWMMSRPCCSNNVALTGIPTRARSPITSSNCDAAGSFWTLIPGYLKYLLQYFHPCLLNNFARWSSSCLEITRLRIQWHYWDPAFNKMFLRRYSSSMEKYECTAWWQSHL